MWRDMSRMSETKCVAALRAAARGGRGGGAARVSTGGIGGALISMRRAARPGITR